MPRPTTDTDLYRPAVGIALFNDDGHVWLGKRFGQKGPYSWQMPQGGIDVGEKPKAAARRELWEETGIHEKDVTFLGGVKGWLYYDFPPEHPGKKSTRGWTGQRQKWYAFRYHGNEKRIDLKSHGPQEFSKWKWASLEDAPVLIVPFKRKVYERMAVEFEGFAKPVKQRKRGHG